MDSEHKICQYRQRLDKTLTSHDLTNEKTIKSLIKDQLFLSSTHENEGDIEQILETKTKEVSNFLDLLRSASGNVYETSKNHDSSHSEWKLKQDSKEFRVMYREGPQGTPFHTLLVEGYIDAPLDACLCVSWESALYKKWWPQYNIPSFKIMSCQCLQKVRIDEHISLVRLKLSWPLSAREALLHFFVFEYFQDDLIVILINTISDLKSIDKSTHGFTADGIPEANDMVRIDLVGGIAMQKVTQERSYFRTIANMDIKLDFVPPTLINFIARQLIGSGFKLYQKAVASVAKSDEDFCKALRDPLYARIRNALYPNNEINEIIEMVDLNSEAAILPEGHPLEIIQNGVTNNDQMIHVNETPMAENSPIKNKIISNEIEEEEDDEKEHEEDDEKEHKEEEIEERKHYKYLVNDKRNFCPSPEVEQALGTLEKVILMIRELGLNSQTSHLSGLGNGYPKSDSIVEAPIEQLNKRNPDIRTQNPSIDNSRHTESNQITEAYHSTLSSKLQEEDLLNASRNHPPVAQTMAKALTNSKKEETNSSQSKKWGRQKNYRLCCFS